MTTVAFFDIDGTIFRNSLMIEHFKKMIKYEVIDAIKWHTEVKQLYNQWDSRQGDFENYLEVLAKVYLEELKGVNKHEINFIAGQVIKINGDMVYKYARDRIKWHQDNGHLVFFISGSPDFLVSKMAKKYNVTEYRGTKYLVDEENKFTGEVIQMWDSESKQKTIRELIEKYDVNLDKSYAYGDTTGDLSMLRMVGNPIAINPNRPLLDSIREDENLSDRVSIIVERKNVIYKLDPNVETL